MTSAPFTLSVTHDTILSLSIEHNNDETPPRFPVFTEVSLTVLAHFAGGDTLDVTERVSWEGDPRAVTWRSGRMFGLALWPTTVSASLERDGEPLTATLDIEFIRE